MLPLAQACGWERLIFLNSDKNHFSSSPFKPWLSAAFAVLCVSEEVNPKRLLGTALWFKPWRRPALSSLFSISGVVSPSL